MNYDYYFHFKLQVTQNRHLRVNINYNNILQAGFSFDLN